MIQNIQAIGKLLKQFRKEKKMTIRVVAQQAGVSNGLISRIENGRTVPSLPVLFGLIEALGVEVAHFFSALSVSNAKPYCVWRAGDYEIIEKEEQAEGFVYKHILNKQLSNSAVECVLLEVHPGAKRQKVSTDAFELKYVIAGACHYKIGEEIIKLNMGDTLFFDGRIPHVPLNPYSESVKMLVVYFYLSSE